MTTVEHGMVLHRYWDLPSCTACALKPQCTTGKERRITRWEHEAVIDAMQVRMDQAPKIMRVRRATVEHPFGTIKAWMGAPQLQAEDLGKGQNGDEPPRLGLQPETRDPDARRRAPHGSHAGLIVARHALVARSEPIPSTISAHHRRIAFTHDLHPLLPFDIDQMPSPRFRPKLQSTLPA